MAPRPTCDLSESVWRALSAESERSGDPVSTVIDRVLASAFDLDRHTLFQVSTSNALVQGVFQGAVETVKGNIGSAALSEIRQVLGPILDIAVVSPRATWKRDETWKTGRVDRSAYLSVC